MRSVQDFIFVKLCIQCIRMLKNTLQSGEGGLTFELAKLYNTIEREIFVFIFVQAIKIKTQIYSFIYTLR